MVCNTSDEVYLCSVPWLFLISWVVVSDQFSTKSAVTPTNRARHQLVTLCRSICAEEGAQILEPFMSSKFCLRIINVSSLACANEKLRFFTRLTDVLGLIEQSSSRVVPRVIETTDTGGDKTKVNEPRRRDFSKRTYKMKKIWWANDVGRFSVTGANDAADKHSCFQGRICNNDV